MFELWKLQDFAPGEGVERGAFKEQFQADNWLDIAVPGDVHQTLIENGRIADPFYNQDEALCAWMEEREWWYRITFSADEAPLNADERRLLVFQGLDTFVTIWLNGEELGYQQNMFREYRYDVSQRLRPDAPNTLALCFHPPLQRAENPPFESWGRNTYRVTMRKAQFGYGWDWGPRLPTIGIWRPVELRRERAATIVGVHFSTLDLDERGRKALVVVEVEVEHFAGIQELTLACALSAPGSAPRLVAEKSLTLPGNLPRLTRKLYMELENPQLWWTHELGEPALYTLQVTLLQNSKQLEQVQQEVGVRTIALDQSPDPAEPGTRFFRFVLNGVPIFARGADWIPAHSFVGALDEARYNLFLSAARNAHMNMLRVWGGGIYEHDSFYQLCDRLGLLVWQDFMFACAMYPENEPTFVAEVEMEARYQVHRLRNHPCMALWCGNNENQWLHDRAYWNTPNEPVPGSLYYDRLLPQIVEALDGETPYWPGSPYGGNDYNSVEDGDVHNWQVWHGSQPRRFFEEPRVDWSPEGVSFVHYAEDMGRFISEFGMHASPVYETLRRNIPSDQLYHHSPAMDYHNKDNPKNKGDNLMQTVTGLPSTLEEYIDYSMIAQAEGLKFGIEHYRRRKPHCSGTLIWQLNDCWPVLSWSILDHYGFGKAGYFSTRRAYAPVLASFKALPDGAVELWITNDTLSELTSSAKIHMGSFADGLLWEELLEWHVPANSSQAVWHGEAGRLVPGPYSYLSVRSPDQLFPANRHFFVAQKALQRIPEPPEVNIVPVSEHELRVQLHASAYACFLHLIVPDEHTHFSDNYFDLEAGEHCTVVVTNPVVVLTPEMVEVKWR